MEFLKTGSSANLTYPYHKHILTLGHNKVLILPASIISLWTIYTLFSTSLLGGEFGYRNKDLGSRCAHCSWGATASTALSEDRAGECLHKHIDEYITHTLTCTIQIYNPCRSLCSYHTCICAYVCICIRTQFTPKFHPIQYCRVHSIFFLFTLTAASLKIQDKTPTIHNLFAQP